MATYGFFRDFIETNAFNTRCRAEEELVDKARLQTDGIENLRAAIGLIGRDAHLGHDLEHALADGLDVALDHFILVHFRRELATAMHVEQRVEGEIRINRLGTVASEAAEMMYFARLARFHHQTYRSAQALADQVMVHGCRRQKSRDRNTIRTNLTIRQDDDVVATVNSRFGTVTKAFDGAVHTGCPFTRIVGDVERLGVEAVFRVADGTNLFQIAIGQDRLAHFQTLAA